MLRKLRQSITVLFSFLVASVISIIAIYFVDQYTYQQKRLSVQKLSSSYVSLIRNNVFQAISATYPLAALIRTQNGDATGFTALATEMLPLYPGAAALQLQPNGIIKHVVPLKGNEGAIGHNLLLNLERIKEAFLAKDTGKLTLAGPFDLVQGGIGAAARLPIFLDDSEGNKKFWGFSTVLFRFPYVLETVKLDSLVEAGFAYELSRIHPDTNKTQLIAHSKEKLIENPEIFKIDVPNGSWTFKISPIKAWRSETLTLLMGMLGVVFTFLITFSAVLIQRLRNNKKQLEKQVLDRTKELSDNLKRLDVALNAAHQGWFDLNIQTAESSVSNEFPVLLGYEPSEFNSNLQEWQGSLHPEEQDTVLNSLKQCIETGKSIDVEYRRKTKDGNWIWLHTIGEIVEKDSSSIPQRMIGIHTDISERKRSEQVLRVLAEGVAIEEGSIFQLMVRQLALAQNARYAFIAKVGPDHMDESNTIAVWADDNYIDNISYSLEGSPCQNIIEQGVCFYPENIQKLFPKDQFLVDMEAESYLGVPLRNSKNEVIGLVVVIDDKPIIEKPFTITLLQSLATRAAIELERLESDKKIKLSAKVFSDAHEGIIITDTKGIIIEVNPTFCEITGYGREEVLGENPRILNSGKQSAKFYIDMWQSIIEHGHWQGEVWNRKKNGEVYAELLTISSIHDDSNHKTTHYLGLFSDISKNKEQQRTLELMAHYDVLTKLPNRVLFADRFSLAVAHSKRTDTLLAVCFLDLDDFKPVNDHYGHEVGDLLLIEVSNRIKTSIREEDTVSRQGGDEFTLLLGSLGSSFQCEQMLERLHHSLAQPYFLGGQSINISASSGVTLYPNDNDDLDALIRHADQAMYQAKLLGKNKYQLFNTEQDQKSIQKQHQLEEMQQALSNNEFCLYYQPKVNMKTGLVIGAEALIRWRHPDKGLISPLQFLPVIEGTELEILIGDWVIDQALSQQDQWQKQGINIEVSVNISSYHLQSASFFVSLEKVLARYPDVSHENFQLEILESSALGDLEIVSHVINTCRDKLGVNVALDDFGTGYSSLTHLRSLSANTIKIDQSFVRDMLDDPSDYAIIDGVIGLSNSFSREVIAEGVETTEHGIMLLLMGCNEAQGYSIARPMPANELPSWLKNYTANEEWLTIANKGRTSKEAKIKLLRLTIEQWQKKFENNILGVPGNNESWPIVHPAKCHLGSWIKGAKQEKIFDDNWVEKLNEVHIELHNMADHLYHTYQQGKIDEARDGLNEMQMIFVKMTSVFGEWE